MTSKFEQCVPSNPKRTVKELIERRVIPAVDVDRFIIDEDGSLTIRLFNPRFDDDRNNVIDLEGVTVDEAIDIIYGKASRLGMNEENGRICWSVAVILAQELL